MIMDEKLISIVSDLVGNFDIVEGLRNDSNRTGVFKIKVSNEILFVKIHNRLSRWNPEVYAYKNWTSALEPFTPKLLHSFNSDNIFGIIITQIQGKTINEFNITDDKILEESYFKAGELLKTLHCKYKGTYFGTPSADGTPYEKNTKIDPVNYIVSSLESLLKEGCDKGLLSCGDKALVDWCINNSNVFADSVPVPTNWDYSQNNWMIDSNGSFTGVIDFENMLWGIDVDSFGVINARYTYDKPKLRQAIFDGYKMGNDTTRQVQLRIVSTKLAIADIAYGSSMNDQRIFTLARRFLDNLK
ncbi:MAG: phosphotransferase [Clostridiaceae bacterium]|mgnify:CR=1 FL=1|nr:phosphotransferase [Clostridiaceae bacterium]